MLGNEIVTALKSIHPNKLTNGEIARLVVAPEPSVRRVTRKLRDRGILDADYVGANWGTNQGVKYGSVTA